MSYDAIIIGAGPGGSTAASALAREGKKVLVLEREKFPRFHIGESLIPFGNDELRAIGAWDKLETGNYMPKLGAEFVLGDSRAITRIIFGRFLNPRYAKTFQVERSRFDNMLIEHATGLGAELWQETRVKSVETDDDGVTVHCVRDGREQALKARWILDASGRDAILAKQLKLPKSDLGMPKKFATFAHFHGVKRNDPPADGHITVVRLGFGWCWIIPLDKEKTSVGLVQTLDHFKATGMKPEECFEHVVQTTPELKARLGSATRVNEFTVIGDYTYRYLENAGPRWALIGDAAGFIDPIFSSGVMIAIKSGFLAASAVLDADRNGKPLSVGARRRYTRRVGKMSKVFLSMIKMFYNNHSFEVFMTPCPDPKMEWAINNLVAGNTNLGLNLRMRVWLFYLICALQKYISIVPRLHVASATPDPAK